MTQRKKPLDIACDLTVAEACALLRVGRTKVEQMCADGVLDTYRLGDGPRAAKRITRESVERVRKGSAVSPRVKHPHPQRAAAR